MDRVLALLVDDRGEGGGTHFRIEVGWEELIVLREKPGSVLERGSRPALIDLRARIGAAS